MAHLRDDKFVISCAARSGSTMLVMLLHSHPDILCHSEVFEAEKLGYIAGRYRRLRTHDPTVSSALQGYRVERPEAFLYDVVFNADGHRAVGFKFKTDEAFGSDPRFTVINQLILKDHDIKIIRLHRRDLVAQYVSHVVTRQTGVLLLRGDEPRPAIKPFEVDPRKALDHVLDVRRRDQMATDAYAQHRSVSVFYEDLVLDNDPARNDLLAFLGVPSAPLSFSTTKILPSLDDLVLNIAEVRRVVATSVA
jgi:LPS sulfotransferase NodH